MIKKTGFGRRGSFGLKPAHCAVLLCSATVAGCSADVARFDSSSFNFNDPPEQTAAVQRPVEAVRGGSDYESSVAHTTPRGPYGVGAGGNSSVDVAALPEPAPEAAAPATTFGGQRPAAQAPAYQPRRSAPSVAAAAPIAKGQQIDVQQGDTLYGLSKRHQVSINELMQVNELKSPDLRLGQKLYLPAGRSDGPAPARALEAAVPAAPAVAAAAAPSLSPPSAEQLAKYNGTYTVKPGDSLYAIARANRVNFAELQQVNGITDPRKVRPGAVLKVPASAVVASTEPMAPASIAPAMAPAAAPSAAASPAVPAAQPTILNKQKAPEAAAPAPAKTEVAAAAPQAAQSASTTTQAANTGKLRWPATGKIIAGFGGRADGTHNDGINVSVPLGTDVHAAESGVVAYSGNELKGYGNLVLIRHDNGWVTAYAHNDELLVKHGDKISRGQVIAKAGKTGTVDQPQVHFELRQGSKPVDPTPYLERL